MTFTERLYTNLGNRIGIKVPEWREQAAGRDADPALFFPERGVSPISLLEEAREFCNPCPVKAECLEEGRNAEYGIWGGRAFGLKGNVFECDQCGLQMKHKSEQPRRWCSDRCRMRAKRDDELRRTA